MADDPESAAFWARALKHVVRRTRGREDAEDLLHAAYIRLQAYKAKAPVANPLGFLVRTAVNLSIDEHRHAARVVYSDPDGILAATDEGPLADEVLAARERLERVKLGLAEMPARRREIFLMNRIEGLTYRQIAGRVALSQSMVEKEMARAIHFLATWMVGY